MAGPSGRVVVTGVGAVTPLGTGIDVFWPRMLAGESAVRPVSLMDVTEYPTKIAAEALDFNAEDWLEKKEARRVDRFLGLAAAAAQMAIQDSAFPEDEELRNETGVLIGSGIGGLGTMSEQTRRLWTDGPSKVSPFLVPYMIPDMASGYVSILHRLRGPNTCVVSACASGADSLGAAASLVRSGEAVAMVAGGAEAPVTPIGMAGFCAARAMTTNNEDPAGASRPFDLDRDGFVIGEGSAVFVLEDLESAKARGAKIYGEIVSCGMSGDAHHITAPDPEGVGAKLSMSRAIKQAGISAEAIDYINAHGTSTKLNDKTETLAVKAVLGGHAHNVPMSSTKSMIGHTLGAAGAIEALVCLLAIRDQIVPPTINYRSPDPECDLDYVPNQARKANVTTCLSNSFGFGGHNVSLVLRKVG